MKASLPAVHMHPVDEALLHFKKADRTLYLAALPHKESLKQGTWTATKGTDRFPALVRSVVSQQLSIKAADAIWLRVHRHLKGEVTPQKVLRTREKTLRAQGLSGAKIKTIQELSRAILEKRLSLTSLSRMHKEEAVASLTQVWGIGRWTAEMFLIFTLNRPDVFSSGDLGLRRSLEKLYDLEVDVPVSVLESYAQHWSPYRSIACRILWAVRDSTNY
jgi:DNA-3-methyladenine glycosylase II